MILEKGKFLGIRIKEHMNLNVQIQNVKRNLGQVKKEEGFVVKNVQEKKLFGIKE